MKTLTEVLIVLLLALCIFNISYPYFQEKRFNAVIIVTSTIEEAEELKSRLEAVDHKLVVKIHNPKKGTNNVEK